MKNKVIARPLAKRFRRFTFRLFIWIILLTGIACIALLVFGYIGASKPVSYLPQMIADTLKPEKDTLEKAELKGFAYIVSVKGNGEVAIKTAEGKEIMSGLKYYSSNEGLTEKWGLDRESAEVTSDSTVSITGEGSSGSRISMLITVPRNKSKIDIDIHTVYTENAIVRRESLVSGFDVPVKEIYRKNRQSDTSSFDPEYWLGKEGVRFGSGIRSAFIYHTPEVSSMQIDTRKSLLFVNLEYSADHPFFNIPFQKDGAGRWTDLSEAAYKAGDTRKNRFTINLGDLPGGVPRIMLVPHGYLAGYVFTEHADGGNIRTHRAAYFGSEDITSISDATGGFARYKIPVTKSIFFPDIDVPLNSSSKKDSEKAMVLDFMDQLNKTGLYDICLHGANSNRKTEEEWIKFMKGRFGTTTWIDHGMFSGTGNRQSFVCDGLNPDSEYYTADLWEKYKTQYFWNASVEELRKLPLKETILKMRFYEASLNLWRRCFYAGELQKMGFPGALKELISRFGEQGELNSFLPERGNAFPTPLFWKHPTRTGNFYSWATDYVKIFSHSEHGVRDEEQKLNKLISNRGIFINHGYFVRNTYEDGVLLNSGGKIKANPYFNQTLDIMSRMHEKGDLYITTIRDLLDYWVLIENISFDYMPDGAIYVNNLNDKPIIGFALAVKSQKIRIDGEIPKSKRAGDDTILWFDLQPGQHVRLQTQ
jgi:hypothetical protein